MLSFPMKQGFAQIQCSERISAGLSLNTGSQKDYSLTVVDNVTVFYQISNKLNWFLLRI